MRPAFETVQERNKFFFLSLARAMHARVWRAWSERVHCTRVIFPSRPNFLSYCAPFKSIFDPLSFFFSTHSKKESRSVPNVLSIGSKTSNFCERKLEIFGSKVAKKNQISLSFFFFQIRNSLSHSSSLFPSLTRYRSHTHKSHYKTPVTLGSVADSEILKKKKEKSLSPLSLSLTPSANTL